MDIFGVVAFEQADERQKLVFRSLSQRLQPLVLEDYALERDDQWPVRILEDVEELPASAEIYFSDPLRDYQSASALAQKSGWQRAGHESLSLSAAMESGQAQSLAESWLERKRAERRTVSLSLPWTQAGLTIGDRVRVPELAGNRDYVVVSLEDGAARRAKAVALAPVLRRPDRTRMPSIPQSEGGVAAGPPLFHMLDLPMWPGVESEQNQFRIACYAKPWREVSLYVSPENSGYQLRTVIPFAAVMGELITELQGSDSGRFMHEQSFEVRLYHGELHSGSQLQILNAANTALVQTATGSWEMLQFMHAEEIAAGHWRLKTLLRGQVGTETEAQIIKQAGAPFILLDDRVVPTGLQPSENGLLLNWRAGLAGRNFTDEYFATQSLAGAMRALKPLSPVHLRCKRQTNGDLAFQWIRRGRLDADSWMGEDIPLGEIAEKYQVQLWHGETLLHSAVVTEPCFLYSGSVPDGAYLLFEVAQISQACGAGDISSLRLLG